MRRAASTALRVVLVMAVAAALTVTVVRVGPGKIAKALRALEPWDTAWASLAFLAALFLNSVRWRLVSPAPMRAGLGFMYTVYLSGVFGNVITPGARFGGEPLRAYFMECRKGGRFSDFLAVALLDKTTNGISFVSAILASLAFLCWSFVNRYIAIPIALAALLPPILLVWVRKLRIQPLAALLARPVSLLDRAVWTRRLFRIHSPQGQFRETVESNVSRFLAHFVALSPSVALAAYFLSTGYWLLVCLCNWILFRSLGLPIGYPMAAVVLTLSTLVSDLGTTPAGIGFLEAAMVGFLAMSGVTGDQAVAAALVSRVVNMALCLGAGGAATLVLTAVYGPLGEAKRKGGGS